MSEALSTPDTSEAAAPETPEAAPAAAVTERDRNLRKTRVGQVVSDAMDKTVVVSTTTRVPHKKFGKIIKHVKRFHVHDEKNEAKVGDRVTIMETRPLSRLKRWRLVEIIKH